MWYNHTPMSDRPLEGSTILVTRPRRQAAELADRLRESGARVILAPAIRIASPGSWTPLDRALRGLDRYDALVFTSANGVDRFFSRARKILGRLPRRPRRLYAIGPGTALALKRRGWRGGLLPEAYEAKALADRLGDVRGWNILLPRARVARDILPSLLRRRGARVDVVEAYRTVPDRTGIRYIPRALKAGNLRAVTFTSASTVEHFLNAAGPALAGRLFREAYAASIGPITSMTLRRRGIRRIIQAGTFTCAGLVRALESRLGRG